MVGKINTPMPRKAQAQEAKLRIVHLRGAGGTVPGHSTKNAKNPPCVDEESVDGEIVDVDDESVVLEADDVLVLLVVVLPLRRCYKARTDVEILHLHYTHQKRRSGFEERYPGIHIYMYIYICIIYIYIYIYV